MRRASSLWRAGLSRSASRTLSIGDTFARWNVVHTARPGPARRAIETANTMRNMYNQQWKVDMSSGSSSSSPRETEREWERASGTEKGKYIHTIFHSLAHILFLIHSAFGAYTIDSVIFAVCASLSVCLCVSVADDWYTFYSRVVLSSLNENRFENVQIYIFCIYIRFVCTDGLNANQVFGNRKHAHTHTHSGAQTERKHKLNRVQCASASLPHEPNQKFKLSIMGYSTPKSVSLSRAAGPTVRLSVPFHMFRHCWPSDRTTDRSFLLSPFFRVCTIKYLI